MERVYLGLAIVGFLVPNTVTLIESVQTGNILFWADPARTTAELFANRTSGAGWRQGTPERYLFSLPSL
jgi:hypothetical protein